MTTATERKTIGLLGGSFNPPHAAHLLMAGWALSAGGVDRVWVIPTGGHPFGKELAPFEDRLAMCRLAFGCYSGRVSVIDIEREERVHYSIETVRRLIAENPETHFRWLLGADALAQSPDWRQFDDLVRLAPPLVVARKGLGAGDREIKKLSRQYGLEVSGFALPNLSSSLVRRLLAQGSDAQSDLIALMPPGVLQYIRAHGLYHFGQAP